MIFEYDKRLGLVGLLSEIPNEKVSTNIEAIKNKSIQSNIHYIDLNGYCFEVTDTKIKKRFFSSFLSMIFFHYWYRLEIVVSEKPFKKMEFAEFKQLVIKSIKNNRTYYENILTYDTIKKEMSLANNFEEISKVLEK
jgi:hypothetical protein